MGRSRAEWHGPALAYMGQASPALRRCVRRCDGARARARGARSRPAAAGPSRVGDGTAGADDSTTHGHSDVAACDMATVMITSRGKVTRPMTDSRMRHGRRPRMTGESRLREMIQTIDRTHAQRTCVWGRGRLFVVWNLSCVSFA
eukprot:4925970-Prymnesium_polylepis.1